VDNPEEVMYRYRQGQMAARLRQETEELLGNQERAVIESVMKRLSSGEALDPQFAVQQWLHLKAIRSFGAVLKQKEKMAEAASLKLSKELDLTPR
jgi:hypothetical protein